MAKIEKTEAQSKQTTVEEGTEFKGTLRSSLPGGRPRHGGRRPHRARR